MGPCFRRDDVLGDANCQTANMRSRLAARSARVVHLSLAPLRAWGMPGARCTHSPACEVGSAHGSPPQVRRDHPAFPHAMVLTASFVLSPVTGLVCHRHQRIKVLSLPGWADKTSANLTPASGRQDHTTSPSAAPVCAKGFAGLKCQSAEALAKAEASLVSVPLIAHRPKPALQPRCAQNAAASTASRPASVTIAIRPSVGRDARTPRDVSTKQGSEIFFESGLDSQITKQPVGQISRPVRMALRA